MQYLEEHTHTTITVSHSKNILCERINYLCKIKFSTLLYSVFPLYMSNLSSTHCCQLSCDQARIFRTMKNSRKKKVFCIHSSSSNNLIYPKTYHLSLFDATPWKHWTWKEYENIHLENWYFFTLYDEQHVTKLVRKWRKMMMIRRLKKKKS